MACIKGGWYPKEFIPRVFDGDRFPLVRLVGDGLGECTVAKMTNDNNGKIDPFDDEQIKKIQKDLMLMKINVISMSVEV